MPGYQVVGTGHGSECGFGERTRGGRSRRVSARRTDIAATTSHALPRDGADATVEFDFGVAFTSIRSVRMREPQGERLDIGALLPDSAGRFWVAGPVSKTLGIYSQQGRRVRALDSRTTSVRAPVSLTGLHQRWVAVLDGKLPAVVIMDERGRPLRRFALPELDQPMRLCNLGDRYMAVMGTGWGRGRGRILHLYTLDGEYQESLFDEPHGGRGACVAAAGCSLYVSHGGGESFSIYDVEARSILSFPGHAAARERADGSGRGCQLLDLFATQCGALLAVHRDAREGSFVYDLYGLDGVTIAARLHSPERVVGVEGPLFYSVRRRETGLTLRVWKLKSSRGAQADRARNETSRRSDG